MIQWGRRSLMLAAALAFCGCAATEDMSYHPSPQLLPPKYKKIGLRLVENRTHQPGLEDKLTLAIRDEFLRDGQFAIVPEADSDGIVNAIVTSYILTPIQYDATLVPISYKLILIIDLKFIDRATNTAVWDEPNIEGLMVFAAQTLPGGMSEEQAREKIWNQLARDIVKRVVKGYGSVTGTSLRVIQPEARSTAPTAEPPKPLPPVTKPY